jgi:hypothetical protein
MALFSNGTEWDWFQDMRCAECVHQVDGEACDDAAFELFVADKTPDFLVSVPTSPSNPLGVECQRFIPREELTA